MQSAVLADLFLSRSRLLPMFSDEPRALGNSVLGIWFGVKHVTDLQCRQVVIRLRLGSVLKDRPVAVSPLDRRQVVSKRLGTHHD